MSKIGLFYGTDTGNTEMVSKKIKDLLEASLGEGSVEIHEIYKKKHTDMAAYDHIILGMPTWYDGELQGDWEEFISEFKQIDFSNKKIALFGLGDQYGYASYFCDALGLFAELIESGHGKISGFWPAKGYEHDFSKAQRGDQFVGLCIDVDNQDDMTPKRLQDWTSQLIKEFSLS